MFISRDTINDIQSRCDIVDVISAHVPLKKVGKSFKCLCPFHNEKTPSFIVNPDKQIFHCFGCQVGGNVFSFIMAYEKIDFQEAVRILAERAGVSIKEEVSTSAGPSIKEQICAVNEMAMNFFHRVLKHPKHGAAAREYLAGRHFDDAAIDKYKLGMAPSEWAGLHDAASKKQISDLILERAGLIIKHETRKTYYDRFRTRLLFPIFNVYNRVIGFGARALDESLPKYINTPETEVFNKGRNLYGLSWAKSKIIDSNLVVIVEGYTDCLRLQICGVENCVATLGTALTLDHVRLIKRYTPNVLMIYDSDKAGQSAMIRSLDLFLEEEMNVDIAILPEGHDPDSYFDEFGMGGFEKVQSQKVDFFKFKIDYLRGTKEKLDIRDKVKIADEMFTTLKKVSNEILRNDYLKKLSLELALDEQVVLTEYRSHLKDQGGAGYRENNPEGVEKKTETKSKAEEMLLFLMLRYPATLVTMRDKITPSLFVDPDYAKIAQVLIEEAHPDEHMGARVMSAFSDGRLHELVARLSQLDLVVSDPEQAVKDCMARLEEHLQKSKIEQIQSMIKKTEEQRNYEEMNRYLKEYKILKEMKTVKS